MAESFCLAALFERQRCQAELQLRGKPLCLDQAIKLLGTAGVERCLEWGAVMQASGPLEPPCSTGRRAGELLKQRLSLAIQQMGRLELAAALGLPAEQEQRLCRTSRPCICCARKADHFLEVLLAARRPALLKLEQGPLDPQCGSQLGILLGRRCRRSLFQRRFSPVQVTRSALRRCQDQQGATLLSRRTGARGHARRLLGHARGFVVLPGSQKRLSQQHLGTEIARGLSIQELGR